MRDWQQAVRPESPPASIGRGFVFVGEFVNLKLARVKNIGLGKTKFLKRIMYFSIINLFMGISFFAAGIVAAFLIFKSRHIAGKLLACAGFAAALWILVSIIYRNIGIIDNDLLLFVARMQYAAGAALMTLYLFFVYAFTHNEKEEGRKKLFAAAVGAFLFLFLVLTILTDAMIKGVKVIQGAKIIVFGSLYPFYILYMIALAVVGYYYLIGKLRLAAGRIERMQVIYILIGSTATLVISYVVNIVLPFFQIQSFLWFGPMSAVFFVIFASYAILRHHLFDVRVVTTELLVFAILITVFIQIFLASGFQEVFLNTLLFLSVVFFSVLLLRGVYVEIEQREKIERLACRLSDTISFATHELRVPVTTFRGYLSMLLDGEYGKLRPEARKCVEDCFNAADEMNRNIETFLNLSKLEVGKLEIFEQKADLREIVAECLSDFTLKAKKGNIDLNFIRKDELPEVSVDKFQIRHVINNLISNAIKYTPEGGCVTMRVSNDERSDSLVFSIEDTGIGIPPDVLPHLFSRYERGGRKSQKRFRRIGGRVILGGKNYRFASWQDLGGERRGGQG
ncbi:MAG: hypothetical protein HY813_00870 [Candidatus Portnoybacteria bacterium]|nr:hypothetical protein [Candidatus Portnoybacteria bacterium]